MVAGPASTGAYPTPKLPEVVFSREDVDWSTSTMAFPMAPDRPLTVVPEVLDDAGKPVDFTRSTGAYPMYDPPVPAPAKAPAKKRSV